MPSVYANFAGGREREGGVGGEKGGEGRVTLPQ